MQINWEWIDFQLKESETDPQLGTELKRLMQTLETIHLSEDEAKDFLKSFYELALGHSIIPPKPHERWAQCYPGSYGVGNTVRVKADAYDGPLSVHNGKRGRVIVIRGGQAIVVYDGAASYEQQYRHDPDKLERLI